MLFRKYIGIDPDTKASGVATLDKKTKEIRVQNLDYFALFKYILSEVKEFSTLVVIEKGELNRSLFNAVKHNFNKRTAAKVGSQIGKNFEASSIIEKFCIHHKIKYQIYVPKTAKFSHKMAKMYFSNLKEKRTNQEQRDALRCILGY